MAPDCPIRALAMLLAMAGCLASPRAKAQVSTTGSASAQVIALLTATSLVDLDFGSVGGIEGAPGTVIVDPAGEGAHYTGGARAVCGRVSSCPVPHPARFAVSCEAGRAYRVALSRSVMARADVVGAPDLEVADLTLGTASRPSSGGRDDNRGTLDGRGHDSFAVGGTLVLPRGTRPAHYQARIEVLVAYE